MDLLSGLQSLFGGDPSSARQKGGGTSDRESRELQKRNGRLKEMLDAARARIADLENQIATMREGRAKVEANDTTQREEIDQLNAKIDELKTMIEQLEAQEEALAEAEEKSESEILERIHTEDVACYRSMKSLVTELQENVNEVELSEDSLTQIRTSFKGIKFFSVFALLSFILLIFVLLIQLGVIGG